ncbi:MAG: YdeI/OmpD-associated family protein [candidate division WOR-3 bacterium]
MKGEINIPAELVAAFKKNRSAEKKFFSLPPAHQQEYIEYIVEAKKPETRRRRVEKALAMILGLPPKCRIKN